MSCQILWVMDIFSLTRRAERPYDAARLEVFATSMNKSRNLR